MKICVSLKRPLPIFFAVFFGLLSGITTVSASVIDAPHNETNHILCGDCHTYSLWWKYSPAGSRSDYTLIANSVCDKCHGPGQYAPNKLSHSFETMAEMHKAKNGDWQTKCVDCHDPHLQGQLDWEVLDPSLIPNVSLATGKRAPAAVTYDAGTNTSTFDYIDADAQSGWLDPALWSAKSGNTRGLILVIEDANGSMTFEVNSAIESVAIIHGTQPGAGTIEVQGELPATFADGATFALIYGQLLRQKITTPNGSERPVKFFDPNITYSSGITGGPADSVNTPPEGICQVCHYYTRYYNYDRQQPDSNDPLYPDGARVPAMSHNVNSTCNSCHGTDKGFKPINADHTFMTSGETSCANCHSASDDFVVDTHNGTCSHCHDMVAGPPILLGSVSTGTTGKWPSTPHNAGNCYDCHDTNGPGPDDITGDFTNHPKAMDSDGDPGNGIDGNGHEGQVTATPRCVEVCHFHKNKDIVSEIHTFNPNSYRTPSAPDPCVKCHQLTITLAGSYSGTTLLAKGTYPSSGPDAGKLKGSAVAGPGDCAHCHTTIASSWQFHPYTGAHSNQVYATGTNLCTRCHVYDQNSPNKVITTIHSNKCNLCHEPDQEGALVGLTATNGPGNCSHCHGADFVLHDLSKFVTFNHESYGLVVPEPATADVPCMECHNEGPDTILDIHSPIIIPPQVLPADFDPCLEYCHDNEGYLKGSASGHGIATLNGSVNYCSTCHADHTSNHPNHITSSSGDIYMNGFVAPTATCVSCHEGDRTAVVHNNKCLLCHEALFRQEIAVLRAGLPDPATYGNADGHLECIECHTKLDATFYSTDSRTTGDKLGHTKDTDHAGKVEATPGCATCHDGPPLYTVHQTFLCVTCHTPKGVLKGSASGHGTGKPAVGVQNDCVSCHGTFELHSSLPIILTHTYEVSLTPSCGIAGCHTNPDLVLGIHSTNGCATCHAPTGDLNTPAVPGGGDCVTCHTTYFDGHTHGTNEHYVSVGTDTSVTLLSGSQPCYDCHQNLNWPGTLTLHTINANGGCTTCHTSTRSVNIQAPYTDVPNVILVGSSSTPITCLDCHSDAVDYGHYCGNGVLNGVGEQCDNGPLNSNVTPDACRENCALPSCGDSVVDTSETCDDGPLNSDIAADACRTDCTPARCGDFVIDSSETCDDGNTVAGDGCSDTCQIE